MTQSDSSPYTRPPSVAGAHSFYPSNPSQLRDQINHYLEQADLLEEEPPLGLIVPHAGYIYSGPVAGWAYKQIVGHRYDTVIVIAPSHFEPFSYAAVMPAGAYQTPLGEVPVDDELVKELVKAGEKVMEISLQGHLNRGSGLSEHSLEVQLPFLQIVLADFKLVPIVVGGSGWNLCRKIGEAVAKIARGRKVLIVASSDLSHYHSYDKAYQLDQAVIDRIQTMDAEGLAEGCHSGILEACGGVPIAATMTAAGLMSAKNVKILRHATSGDVTGGMRDQVVGYLAAAFYPGSPTESNVSKGKNQDVEPIHIGVDFTHEEKAILLSIARKATIAAVEGKQYKAGVPTSAAPNLHKKRSVFVTIKKEGNLRGCIGNLAPSSPLYALVADVARQSALSDPRFAPVAKKEVKKLNIEVTVLSPMIQISSPGEVVPGLHGVLIRYKGYQGLLLPQVAEEHGWDREQFLVNVCMKAGLSVDTWRNPKVELYIFTADHFAEDEF